MVVLRNQQGSASKNIFETLD